MLISARKDALRVIVREKGEVGNLPCTVQKHLHVKLCCLTQTYKYCLSLNFDKILRILIRQMCYLQLFFKSKDHQILMQMLNEVKM